MQRATEWLLGRVPDTSKYSIDGYQVQSCFFDLIGEDSIVGLMKALESLCSTVRIEFCKTAARGHSKGSPYPGLLE